MSNTNTSNVIIAGDWNTTFSPIDKRSGQPWKATNYRNFLVSLMDELNLIDIYRQIHPIAKSFSYESKPLNLKSRIDFFLISRSLSSCISFFLDCISFLSLSSCICISQDGVQSGCSELRNNNDDFTSNHATTHGKSTQRIQASER